MSTITSPLPITGSGTSSIASGAAKDFRTLLSSAQHLRFAGNIQTWYYPRIEQCWFHLICHAESTMADAPGSGLAGFLRSRRARLSPQEVGLPIGRRRRTPGLRREEVAELAGIGVDWYIRLEQGRATPSVATVQTLASALRLSKTEQAHLRALTKKAASRDAKPFVRETVPEVIRRVVQSLSQPAYVTGQRWDVLVWNAAADKILGFSRMPESDRNTLLSMLTVPATRRLFGASWALYARRMVAQFRTTYDLHTNDPAFKELVARLQAGSREFAGWWKEHEIGSSSAVQKRISLPKKGSLRFEYASFQANDDPSLKLVIYVPG